MYAVPALIGAFWGVPLIAREIEARTLPLAWTQSVTRTRWLAVRLGLTGLASAAATGLLSVMVTWWASPLTHAVQIAGSSASVANRLDPVLFGARGIAPVAYAAFAFALGVTAGLLIRRIFPAMAVILIVFAAIQIAMPRWIRPDLMTPLRAIVPLNTAGLTELMVDTSNNSMTVAAVPAVPAGGWVISNQSIDAAGHVFTGPATRACLHATASQQACVASVARLHLRQLVTYQPASRYWTLQWYETAIFLGLALVLAGFCTWRVRRHHLS